MAKHDGVISAASIWENMERRFSYLYTEEHYNGQDAGEYEVLEGVLFESSEEDDSFLSMDGEQSIGNFADPMAIYWRHQRDNGKHDEK